MDPVTLRYEQYPYPSRDPEDERHRLIEGSPSHPLEIDHHLFGGRRDWSAPFRVLVAGGGTGDGLIMLAQKLADIGCPAELTYLDTSTSARGVAEARAAIRGLESINFVTADLTAAPELGTFDYVDCCGVLHHLDDPDAGLGALARSLSADGGIGLMVYAPHGRSGVYPLQGAFATLLASEPPAQHARLVRDVLAELGENHPFARNVVLGDHRGSDAELLDLLASHRDRPYTVMDLLPLLDASGLVLASFIEPARYDPRRYLPRCDAFDRRIEEMPEPERAALAEQLAGTMKTHIAYAIRRGRDLQTPWDGTASDATPHLRSVSPAVLAAAVYSDGGVSITTDGHDYRIDIPAAASPLVAAIDGRHTVAQIADASDVGPVDFLELWSAVDRELAGLNLLNYSRASW